MATSDLEEAPDILTEEEAEETFSRFRTITSGLLRVPKAELEARLAEKRIKSRRRVKPSP
jgi:hypothetical protein